MGYARDDLAKKARGSNSEGEGLLTDKDLIQRRIDGAVAKMVRTNEWGLQTCNRHHHHHVADQTMVYSLVFLFIFLPPLLDLSGVGEGSGGRRLF